MKKQAGNKPSKRYGKYVRIQDMTWPLPSGAVTQEEGYHDSAAYKLHYQPEALTAMDRYYLSSIISAYGQMIGDTVKKRQMIVRELRKHYGTEES